MTALSCWHGMQICTWKKGSEQGQKDNRGTVECHNKMTFVNISVNLRSRPSNKWLGLETGDIFSRIDYFMITYLYDHVTN